MGDTAKLAASAMMPHMKVHTEIKAGSIDKSLRRKDT
jgi:hypothetical protein